MGSFSALLGYDDKEEEERKKNDQVPRLSWWYKIWNPTHDFSLWTGTQVGDIM